MKPSPTREIKLSIQESFDLTSALAKVRSAHAPAFSPDGCEIAFLSDLTGLPQIWAVSLEGGMPRQVTALDEPITRFAWSPDGQQIAFELAPGGGIRTQLFLVGASGMNLRRLTKDDNSAHQLGLWHPLGDKLSFSSNCNDPAHLHTYWLEIETGAYQPLAHNPGIGHLTDLDVERNLALLYRMDERTDSDSILLDLDNCTERLLTPHMPPAKYQRAQFGREAIYLISDEGREFPAFACLALDAAKLTFVAAREKSTLVEFVLNPARDAAFLLWQDAKGMALTKWTVANQQSRTIREFPSQAVISDLVLSPNGQRLAFSLSHPRAPKEVFVMDMGAEEPSQLTFSPHAGVDYDSLVAPKLVYFPADDGLDLQGWLYLPERFAKPGAAVVSFHGGPEAREDTDFKPLYQALLAQGLAVLAPNIRGSAGFGKAYEHADNGRLRAHALADVAACADFLVQAGIAHPRKLGVVGFSYGGYLALVGLTRYADLFAAGVVCSGFSDFATFFDATEVWIASISKTIYGAPQEDAAFLRTISPLHGLDSLNVPVLLFHGANDTNIPVSDVEQVAAALFAHGRAFDLYLFEDEGHELYRLKTRTARNHTIVEFFVKELLGSNPP